MEYRRWSQSHIDLKYLLFYIKYFKRIYYYDILLDTARIILVLFCIMYLKLGLGNIVVPIVLCELFL